MNNFEIQDGQPKAVNDNTQGKQCATDAEFFKWMKKVTI
jgi:hypothetical protein